MLLEVLPTHESTELGADPDDAAHQMQDETVQITQAGTLLRTHRARHDKTKKFGALNNPGGRPRRSHDVAYRSRSQTRVSLPIA
jgi:hypothetical protein